MALDNLIDMGMPAVIGDSVRSRSSPDVNQRIDQETFRNIWHYATQARDQITRRIDDLDREWDIERLLETSTAGLTFAGLGLGLLVNRRWLLLPFAVTGCLLKHALGGSSPPVALLRRWGVRTRGEIDTEKYALKLLRGDFETIKSVCEQTHLAIEAFKLSRA